LQTNCHTHAEKQKTQRKFPWVLQKKQIATNTFNQPNSKPTTLRYQRTYGGGNAGWRIFSSGSDQV
jgi:hypothetical protein